MRRTLVLAASFWLMLAAAPPEPTDAALIKSFTAHRAEFEAVRRMAVAEHGIGRIAPDFVLPSSGITDSPAPGDMPPPERMRRYRELFRQIGAAGGIGFSGTRVYFYIFDDGFGGQGTSKGIVWSAEPLTPMRRNLDLDKAVRPVSGFRRIAPGWYLEYQAD